MRVVVFILTAFAVLAGARAQAAEDWHALFAHELPLLGHRNWIVIADSAFPQQNAAGIETIDTGEDLLPVLKEVLTRLDATPHVRPIIFRDRELRFITEAQSPGISRFIAQSDAVLGKRPVQTLLHENVFKKFDTESKLFKVLVLKTRGTLAYSSFFLQLDAAYWDSARESALRKAMRKADAVQ